MVAKKILVHIITSLKIGGAEALLVDFVLHPQMAEFEHHVIYFYDGPHRAHLQKAGIHCYKAGGLINAYDPFCLLRIYRYSKKINPQCIHTWLWSATIIGRIIGKLLKIPVLSSFHSEVNQDGKLRMLLDYYTQSLSQKIVAVSDGIAQSLIDLHKPTIMPRLTVIKNGINASYMATLSQNQAKRKRDIGLLDEHYVIGSVGRWVPCKNYSFLISLFAEVYKKNSSVRLLLLGTGELKHSLMQQVADKGLRHAVIFIEGESAVGYYPLMDCFIQTTFKEGISLALLEALSCSLPCIVIQNSPHHDVIRHEENGLLVSEHCMQRGAFALEQLLYNKNFAAQLAAAGKATVMNEFDVVSMISAYKREYMHLMH